MEDLLKGIFIRFGGVGVIGSAILVVLKIFFKYRPISLLTAHQVEKKLLSKETQYSVRIVKSIFEVAALSLLLLVLSILIYISPITEFIDQNLLLYCYFSFVTIVLLWSLYHVDLKKKTPKLIKEHPNISLISLIVFLIMLFVIPAYYVGTAGKDENTNFEFIELIPYLPFLFFSTTYITILLWFVSKKTLKVFDVERSKDLHLYFEIKGEKWYFQYRMHDDVIYLSDNKSLESSRKFRFLKWDEISQYVLCIDDQESGGKFDIRQSYNNHAEERDKSEIEPWKIQERQQFLDRLNRESCKMILEIGAGSGKDSLFFHQNGLEVTTVDFSEEMVRLCKEKELPDVHCMDFRHLDFPDNRFDAVYALNCLLHIPKAEIDGVLLEIRRVLKPNGLFFYGVYGGWNWEGVWEDDTYEPKRFFNFYTDDDIQKLVQKYFILEDFHTIDMGEGKPHFQSMTLRKPKD